MSEVWRQRRLRRVKRACDALEAAGAEDLAWRALEEGEVPELRGLLAKRRRTGDGGVWRAHRERWPPRWPYDI